MGCATVLMSKRLNITCKYNGVKKAAGYVGSNPIIFTKQFSRMFTISMTVRTAEGSFRNVEIHLL